MMTSCAEGEEIVLRLTPPIFSDETVLQSVTCTRPMREGKFNISSEQIGSKRVVTCAGHGGSGWATLFGSVERAIRLFEEAGETKAPICVVGSGCIGLVTAIELVRRGYTVSKILTKEIYDTTSWRAGGYCAMVSVKTSPEEQANLDRIGEETFAVYQQIDRGEHPYVPKQAVRKTPVFSHMSTETGLEDLVARGLIPPLTRVALDFGEGVIHPNYVRYETYFLEATLLMRAFLAEIERLRIGIEIKKLNDFEEVAEPVIFNCTGIGARELLGDNKMIPVRGHLFLLSPEAGVGHMNYMIYTTVEQDGKEEYIYLFPKRVAVSASHPEGIGCRGIIGGTFIPHADRLSPSDLEELDRLEFKKMFDRTRRFFSGR
jgi:D-amino-acid oxidase